MAAEIIIRERESLTEAQRQEIRDSFLYALNIQRQIANDVNFLWDEGDLRSEDEAVRVRYWGIYRWLFIQKRKRHIRRFRRRINRLYDWLNTGRITVIYHGEGDFVCRDGRRGASRGAYILSWFFLPFVQVKRFHMCARWFTSDQCHRGGLIIHELCHEMGMSHPASRGSATAILNLHNTNRKAVIKSPITYQLIFREYAGCPYIEILI